MLIFQGVDPTFGQWHKTTQIPMDFHQFDVDWRSLRRCCGSLACRKGEKRRVRNKTQFRPWISIWTYIYIHGEWSSFLFLWPFVFLYHSENSTVFSGTFWLLVVLRDCDSKVFSTNDDVGTAGVGWANWWQATWCQDVKMSPTKTKGKSKIYVKWDVDLETWVYMKYVVLSPSNDMKWIELTRSE